MADYVLSSKTKDKPFFPKFMLLNEDIQLNIISFISDTPFATTDTTYTNNINQNQLLELGLSPLTYILPVVSKHFHSLLKSTQADYLWKESLIRRIENESFIWKNGLMSLITKLENNTETTDSIKDVNDANIILNAAYKSYSDFYGLTSPVDNINQLLFRNVVCDYVRIVAPVFVMEGDAKIDQVIGLHLFEPRYRLLMEEVMSDMPFRYKMGEALPGPNYPTFIYANNTPIGVSTPAVIVQVNQCVMHENGEADVFLMPIAHVWLERIWMRPNTGRLHMASAVRMPEKASLNMEDNSALFYHATHHGQHRSDDHVGVPNSAEYQSIFQILSEVYQHNRLQEE